MISKLAKSIAHFFVIQNITDESKEVIYAYGMELLISDVLNTVIVLIIALISHTLPAAIIFVTVFMTLRKFVGGYHANGHLSCMLTLIAVMLVFSYGVCNIQEKHIGLFTVGFVALSLPIIFIIAPVRHPNKPISEEKMEKLKRKSRLLSVLLSISAVMLVILHFGKLSIFVSSGILLSALAALFGYLLNSGDGSKKQ